MGQYFKIVNPTKRQYIDASKFDEDIKSSGILRGNHAVAVAVLVCNLDQVSDSRGNLRHAFGPLAGSWCGDPIFVVGDDHTKSDVFGIKTSTIENLDRNLYWMAEEEFEDISYKAIAMLCEARDGFAEEIAERAAASPSANRYLVNLGHVVFIVGCESLKQALEKVYGKDWVSKYKESYRTYSR
jgi:hypothetical protein